MTKSATLNHLGFLPLSDLPSLVDLSPLDEEIIGFESV